MNPDALEAWMSLYAGVGLLAALCAAIAVAFTVHELRSGRWRPRMSGGFDYVLAAPKVWVRWQLNYLRGAPTLLAIALFYAHHIGFATLGAV